MELKKIDEIEMYCGEDFEDVIDAFKHIEGCEEVTPIEEFNHWMEELYNMCDRYRIWVVTQ